MESRKKGKGKDLSLKFSVSSSVMLICPKGVWGRGNLKIWSNAGCPSAKKGFRRGGWDCFGQPSDAADAGMF